MGIVDLRETVTRTSKLNGKIKNKEKRSNIADNHKEPSLKGLPREARQGAPSATKVRVKVDIGA